MSNKSEPVVNVSKESETKPDESKPAESVTEVVAETMIREVTPTAKCLKEDVHVAFKCCVYCWSFSLNGCECTCGCLSQLCIGMSKLALCIKGALEEIDCDKH